MMTAKTVARDRLLGRQATPVTQINVKKVTQFRGESAFEDMVRRFMTMSTEESPAEAEASAAKGDALSNSEAEAERMAEEELGRTANIGESIVPDLQKKAN
jgi:hypothetical protein